MAKKAKLRINMEKKGDKTFFKLVSSELTSKELISFMMALEDYIKVKINEESVEEFQGK